MSPANDPSAEPPEAPNEGDERVAQGQNQEIRQPAALQHGHQQLRDARPSVPDGQGRHGVRGPRRQDRRGHHPLRADPDHRRGGRQGRAEPAAGELPAAADLVLRRQPADAGAALSRPHDGRVCAEPGADAQVHDRRVRRLPSVRPASLRPADGGNGQAEPGAVPERDEDDVLAVRRQCAGCRGCEAGRRRGWRGKKPEAPSSIESCATSSPRCSAASTT